MARYNGYLKMLWENLQETVTQIDEGNYPQFDDNARDSIYEELQQAVLTVKRQAGESSEQATAPPSLLQTLSTQHLPEETSLKDLRDFTTLGFSFSVQAIKKQEQCT